MEADAPRPEYWWAADQGIRGADKKKWKIATEMFPTREPLN